MTGREGVLLTGATGFLGRFLLRELLATGRRVAVLARDTAGATADDRVRELTDFASRTLGTPLPRPTVLAGDLREPRLGLTAADRGWLALHCRSAVHAAASVSFRPAAANEPWGTNLEGTRRVVALAAAVGIDEFHHVSTAFVCGDRTGRVAETDPDPGAAFHNDYERSKCAAEVLVRAAPAARVTVYRPSVIVGDSRTGYATGYHGMYRFLELADRLARPEGELRTRRLPLRLPFHGDEPRDLVPVDWVARAVARLVSRREAHGRTYHLTAAEPVPVRDIKAVAEREFGIDGVELVGRGPLPAATEFERAFLDGLREYWPYLDGDPVFDRENTLAVLPDLPPPRIDAAALARLIRFAVADRWGRRPRGPRTRTVDCAGYIERFFPAAAAGSFLAGLPITTTLGFDVRGPGGGQWACRIAGGRVVEVCGGTLAGAEVTYRTDIATFSALVSGRESPQEAFFARRVEIAGRVEAGLKLARLFGRFVREVPYRPRATEAAHAPVA